MSQFVMRQKFVWQVAISILSHDNPDSLLSNKKIKFTSIILFYNHMNYCKNLQNYCKKLSPSLTDYWFPDLC